MGIILTTELVNIKDYKFMRYDRSTNGMRLEIYVRSHLKAEIVEFWQIDE